MRVCVITGTRAEYGLLYWLMKEIQARHAKLRSAEHLAPVGEVEEAIVKIRNFSY